MDLLPDVVWRQIIGLDAERRRDLALNDFSFQPIPSRLHYFHAIFQIKVEDEVFLQKQTAVGSIYNLSMDKSRKELRQNKTLLVSVTLLSFIINNDA